MEVAPQKEPQPSKEEGPTSTVVRAIWRHRNSIRFLTTRKIRQISTTTTLSWRGRQGSART